VKKETVRPRPASTPTRMIVVSFAAIILAGTFLLMLPFSSRSGSVTPLWNALFTATSATCVTGLVVYDTYTYFSPFGQAVILCLIQLGGLGLVTFTAFFNLIVGRKLGLRDMQLASESISADTMAEMPRRIRLAVLASLLVETAGAALLCTVFIPKYGKSGLAISLFLAVSAFCNAGFDILGREGPFSSLSGYNGSPVVLFTLMLLIVVGGLGFAVWQDLLEWPRTRRLQLHTRIVLKITAFLIVFGAVTFLFLEWGNPRTLGSLPFFERLNASLFQSVSFRTAGFNSVDTGGMREITKVLGILLMFIGAAPGSTGGGIKVTAVAVLLCTVFCVARGREDTVIYGRRVPKSVVYKAMAVTTMGFFIVALTSLVIHGAARIDDRGLTGIDVIFETVSAFSTAGLSSGVTAVANLPSKVILILTMFIGRVGPVAFVLSMAMRTPPKRREVIPDGKIYL
jgi:trk system potassium uptake protein TrkH